MKILHLLKAKPDETVSRLIVIHKEENDVKVIDLSEDNIVYESLIDDIFNCDRVISW